MKSRQLYNKVRRISFWTRLIDLIAPRSCPVCGNRLGISEDLVCCQCLLTLPRTHYADDPYDNPMARLFWGRFNIEKAAALFFYQTGSEKCHLIFSFKYDHRPDMARFIGRTMVMEMRDSGFFEGIDLLIPMPITPRRERERGYNQSTMIALGISEETGIPVADNVVRRTRFEKSQTHKTILERMENVEAVFELVKPDAIRGRHLLVIDDVVTTGFTMYSCCRELSEVADCQISILSVAFTKN